MTLNNYYCLSTSFNVFQHLSMSFNIVQCLLNFLWCLSMSFNIFQCLSMSFNLFQCPSTSFDVFQHLLTFFNVFQPLSTTTFFNFSNKNHRKSIWGFLRPKLRDFLTTLKYYLTFKLVRKFTFRRHSWVILKYINSLAIIGPN